MHRIRVFLDSNVLFSAIYSGTNSPGKILDLHVDGKLQIVICRLVLDEVIQALKTKKPEKMEILQRLLFSEPPEILSNPPIDEVTKLPATLQLDDALILLSAIESKSNYFITGDKHFLKNRDLLKISGISIATAGEFIKQLGY